MRPCYPTLKEAAVRRRCMRMTRNKVMPITRNDPPVVRVPMANKVGDVAEEIRAQISSGSVFFCPMVS